MNTKSSLSSARRTLLQLMQRIHFGRIENLAVRDGQPVFDPCPRIIREVKFAAENGPHPQRGSVDFLLKKQVVELFEHFDRNPDGVIERLEIKHGLPFHMLVEEPAA